MLIRGLGSGEVGCCYLGGTAKECLQILDFQLQTINWTVTSMTEMTKLSANFVEWSVDFGLSW